MSYVAYFRRSRVKNNRLPSQSIQNKTLTFAYGKPAYTFYDNCSARTVDRPALQDALRLAKQKMLVIRVTEMLVLAGTQSAWDEMVEEAKLRGVAIHVFKENVLITRQGQIQIGNEDRFLSWKEGLVGNKVARTKRDLVKSLRHGGGMPPYGFEVRGGKLVPSSREQKAIEVIHALSSVGRSAGSIAEHLNAEYADACRGSRWHRTTVGRIMDREENDE